MNSHTGGGLVFPALLGGVTTSRARRYTRNNIGECFRATVLSRLSGSLGARRFGAGYRIAGLTNQPISRQSAYSVCDMYKISYYRPIRDIKHQQASKCSHKPIFHPYKLTIQELSLKYKLF